MDLIYINSGVGSVFSSQVLALLNFHFNSGKFNRIVLLCGVRNNNEREKARELLSGSSFKTIYYKTFPNYLHYNLLSKKEIRNALEKAEATSDSVFHIRGELSAFLSLNEIKKVTGNHSRIIADIRGASLEEVKEFQKQNPLLKPFKLLNYYRALKSLKNYKTVSVVSDSLKEYVLSNTSVQAGNIAIVPCLASANFTYNEEKREQLREELCLNREDCLIVFSSGGTAGWQNTGLIIKIAESGWKILNLSQTPVEHPNIINRFVPFHLVPAYLSAADIAIIFREKSVVNKVASPVKFGEYLCCGLPVIADRNVDMISEYIESTGHGVLYNSVLQINKNDVELLLKLSKKQISETASDLFQIEKISSLYLDLYKKVLPE